MCWSGSVWRGCSAPDLAQVVSGQDIGDVVIGSVLGDSSQRAIQVRIASFLAGIPETVPVHTVNRCPTPSSRSACSLCPASMHTRSEPVLWSSCYIGMINTQSSWGPCAGLGELLRRDWFCRASAARAAGNRWRLPGGVRALADMHVVGAGVAGSARPGCRPLPAWQRPSRAASTASAWQAAWRP